MLDLAANGDVGGNGNGDGFLTEEDRSWASLKLWRDEDHDGICDHEEVSSLGEAGIARIALSYSWSGRRDSHGNLLLWKAKLASHWNGQLRWGHIYDVFLLVEQ